MLRVRCATHSTEHCYCELKSTVRRTAHCVMCMKMIAWTRNKNSFFVNQKVRREVTSAQSYSTSNLPRFGFVNEHSYIWKKTGCARIGFESPKRPACCSTTVLFFFFPFVCLLDHSRALRLFRSILLRGKEMLRRCKGESNSECASYFVKFLRPVLNTFWARRSIPLLRGAWSSLLTDPSHVSRFELFMSSLACDTEV